MMEIYKNLFVDHHCFFVKLGRRPKSCKMSRVQVLDLL